MHKFLTLHTSIFLTYISAEVILMAMSAIFTLMVSISVLYGCYNRTLTAVSAAVAQGAQSAIELCLAMAGVLCLWSGVMEVMQRTGIAESIRRGLFPLLRRLFPMTAGDAHTMNLISANVSANLLGLGNAATPLGIQAAERMARGTNGIASPDLCRFVVCNTASIQLIPTTVAALRASAGCATPFDILPAVWITSAVALTAGLVACHVLERLCNKELAQ